MSWDDVPNIFTTSKEPPSGETRKEFENRIANSVNEALESRDDTILFVSQGAFAHVLFSLIETEPLRIENGVIYKIYYDNCWYVEKATL